MKNYFSLFGQSIVLGSLLAGSMAVGEAIAKPNSLYKDLTENSPTYIARQTPIIVYGRSGCSFTREVINVLQRNSISYELRDINYGNVKQEMFDLMYSAGINIQGNFSLPVVYVKNKTVMISPDGVDVVNKYRSSVESEEIKIKEEVDNSFYGIFSRNGGFKIGNVDRLPLSSEKNPYLHLAIKKTFSNGGFSYKGENYSYFELDSNGDGRKEAFVFLHGVKGQGENGKNIWIYEALESGQYRLIEVFKDTVALLPYKATTIDWKQMIQIPGSIINLEDNTQYNNCAVGSRRGPLEGKGLYRSLHFYRYCNRVTNKKFTVFGSLIELPPANKIISDEVFSLDEKLDIPSSNNFLTSQPFALSRPDITNKNPLNKIADQKSIEPPKPVTSRPPNGEEIALLDRSIRDQGSKAPSLSPSQKVDRQTLQTKASKFIKPFAGGWMSADNQKYYVYPSTRPDKARQACIIIEKDGTQDLQIGVASGNSSGTDINIGTARMFKTQDSKTVALRVPGGDALVPLYASGISADITPGNLEMMQQNGCMTSFPGIVNNSAIAQKNNNESPNIPNKERQVAKPDGVYTSSLPGIELRNATCGKVSKFLFWTGPGYCTDKLGKSGITIEDATVSRNGDGSTTLKAKFFNLDAADAVIEIYESNGKLVDFKIIDGYKSPTGFTESFIDVAKTPMDFLKPYPVDDPRRGKSSNNFVGSDALKIPKGGMVKITKSSQRAFLYNSIGIAIDLYQYGKDVSSKGISELSGARNSKEAMRLFVKDSVLSLDSKFVLGIYKTDPAIQPIDEIFNLIDYPC